MLTIGADIQIFGGASTTQGTKDSFEEFTSLSREIDEYMDVWFYMESVREGPSGTNIGKGNIKKHKINASITNIILSSKKKGNPGGELRRKKKSDRDEAFGSVVSIAIAPTISLSLFSSSPPPMPVNDDVFRVTINHNPLSGFLKFNTSSGEVGILFS
ncbi:hypothetical protein J1N35_017814 [Gossypium stocksii]|uniref:Uncharacterized protein n=1 Tax=Gossypium stocksii TaxID=47602 RepID=A0A9D3VNZ3_9ROSI|nr:hypothetical protein J1N35_017814 [Gossypium stocksii]